MARGPRMPSIMPAQHRFSEVPGVNIQRSVFNRSHGHKLTMDAGYLVPVYVDEVLPGDTFHMRMHFVARLTTPIKPLMDNLYLESFFFFVPYRLVWDNFRKFMGEQVNPGDSISFTVPILGVPFTPTIGSLMDYMGVMPQLPGNAVQTPNKVNALPFRAYNLIYNQWFRDENLINSATTNSGDGPDGTPVTAYPLQKRGKRHDYFTSCLPFLQKGTATAVAPTPVTAGVSGPSLAGATTLTDFGLLTRSPATNPGNVLKPTAGANNEQLVWARVTDVPNPSGLQIFINDLRLAFQQQKFLERDARGGTRYIEIIKSHFGVVSPDARQQRAEYLGGGSTPITVTPIGQTAQKSAVPVAQTTTTAQGAANDSPMGNLGGVGIASGSDHGFVKSFTEHGVIIGIVNVRADLTYQSGLEKMWTRQTRFDFYWPEFAHIGEQSVLNQEIWWTGQTATTAQDVATFGYQERYGEYRYKPSRISGLYRSYATGTLDVWHLSEKFGSLPTLAQTFIEDQTTSILARNLYVPSEPDIFFDSYFELKCARPMPVYGVPGFIDHF